MTNKKEPETDMRMIRIVSTFDDWYWYFKGYDKEKSYREICQRSKWTDECTGSRHIADKAQAGTYEQIIISASVIKTIQCLPQSLCSIGGDIGDAGAASLSEALMTNTTITELNLKSNSDGEKTMRFLLFWLCVQFQWTKLETLERRHWAERWWLTQCSLNSISSVLFVPFLTRSTRMILKHKCCHNRKQI